MAVLSVTIPNAAVARVQAAVGAQMGLSGPATTSQVQDFCRAFLRGICVQQEARQREAVVQSDSETVVAAEFPA
jgi:hypothetical protein